LRLHRQLRPRTYLEIGTWQGASLKLASCASLAIDPDFQLTEDVVGVKPLCVLHQTTSDKYFATNDPAQMLGAPIDFAFIDALHNFEFVLRDFIATERHCTSDSIIALHDCCPLDYFMTRDTYIPETPHPTKYPGYWTGDVWKMVPVLREYRPRLALACLDAKPTGLAMCGNLDPDDRTLSDNYAAIVQRWSPVTLEDYGMARLWEDCRVVSSDEWISALQPLGPEIPAVDRAAAPAGTSPVASPAAGRAHPIRKLGRAVKRLKRRIIN
jgi:hypothetical protein